MRQFIDIVAENATEMPEMVYHGTNLRAWNEVAGHDEPIGDGTWPKATPHGKRVCARWVRLAFLIFHRVTSRWERSQRHSPTHSQSDL